MRKLALMALLPLLLISCKRDADVFTGDYTYKTSGVVELTNDSGSVSDLKLSDKVGSMSIKRLDKNSTDSVLVIKNELNGGVKVLRARSFGDSLSFKPYSTSFTVTLPGSLTSRTTYTAEINVTRSEAMIYDDRIVITEQYSGSVSSENATDRYTLTGKDIITVATKND